MNKYELQSDEYYPFRTLKPYKPQPCYKCVVDVDSKFMIRYAKVMAEFEDIQNILRSMEEKEAFDEGYSSDLTEWSSRYD